MAEFPVPLDNLIKYVPALHPDGSPLDRVSDAFSVSAALSEEADALLGHFVDQARRSGATWSQIGEAMGVTKQAAQKRFVPAKYGDFSRFTLRARATLAAARTLAGDADVSAAHLGSASLLDPAGLAAKIVGRAGLTPDRVYAALGTAAPAPPAEADPAALAEIACDVSGKEALKSAVKAALGLDHNYIGTEHLLLGVIDAGGPAAAALAGLGLSGETAREYAKAEIEEFQAARGAASAG
ncbi:MAG: Clp protease N-terminal domain-containing protein [Nocardiopsaceae bacterium]|nr:Clp protease N-terminal domain-containing protein [Nocardiopsaceae bacterium]